MSTENLFKSSNRKDFRGVVLANILESVGIPLDRSETYSRLQSLWKKNPQFGQSIFFDKQRNQET